LVNPVQALERVHVPRDYSSEKLVFVEPPDAEARLKAKAGSVRKQPSQP